jgi:hypothetical protein
MMDLMTTRWTNHNEMDEYFNMGGEVSRKRTRMQYVGGVLVPDGARVKNKLMGVMVYF